MKKRTLAEWAIYVGAAGLVGLLALILIVFLVSTDAPLVVYLALLFFLLFMGGIVWDSTR